MTDQGIQYTPKVQRRADDGMQEWVCPSCGHATWFAAADVAELTQSGDRLVCPSYICAVRSRRND